MPWLVWLLLGGGVGLLYALASGSPDAISPSGKPWPPGVTNASVAHAVRIALTVETNPASLLAFANVLESYDARQAALLAQAAGAA